jgi:hypothetical protein
LTQWGLEIFGEERTIARLQAALPPDGVWLIEEGGFHVLIDQGWQGADKWEAVEVAGRELVKSMNGLMRLADPRAEGVRAGAVLRLNEDGFWDYYEPLASGARVSQIAVEVLVAVDGSSTPPPDPLPEWIAVAQTNQAVRVVTADFGLAEDWGDLYKVYERTKQALGRQADVEAIAGRPTRRRFTQTAQHYRHADHPLPQDPMGFDEAREFVARLIRELIRRSVWLLDR